jgi:hypothetical protein
MRWMSVKLPDNFQMRKHSWPCRFHIIVVISLMLIKIILTHFVQIFCPQKVVGVVFKKWSELSSKSGPSCLQNVLRVVFTEWSELT